MPLRGQFTLPVVLVLMALSASIGVAQPTAAPAPPPAPAPPMHLLLLTQSKCFEHAVVKRKGNDPCRVERVFQELADKTHLFTVESIRDAALITPEKLKDTQIVVFYTTGDIPLNVDAFDQWLKDGGAFLGIHCAT